jgi:abortive infection bacteriophage resistance protein
VRKHILKPAGSFVFRGACRMTIPFTKPATTYQEQVELLKQRGMLFEDEAMACFYLEHLNYYRVGAYWLPFEADHGTHQFQPGTRFKDVLDLYRFDRELRLLIMDAIERIEVSVRAHWAYVLSHHHGPHAHLDAALANDVTRWQDNLRKLTKEVNRSDEVFIRHLKRTYAEALPPVWAVCEVMSLGLLSKWYGNLQPMTTRSGIASVYRLDEAVLGSWLHHLSLVRNICAHHSRLWNREFKVIPKLPGNKPKGLSSQFVPGSRKLYNTLVILLYWMDTIAPVHTWRERLTELLLRNESRLNAMGFPQQWQERSIWGEPLEGNQP